MANIKPFSALRPQSELAATVASRPYDVLNSQEARLEANDNQNSFLHITKSEIDLPETIDVHSQLVYDTAKNNLASFIQKNILFHEAKPCYYIYQLVMNGRSQTGLVCVSSLQDYFNDVIKKHEFTQPVKEKDRIDHMRTIEAQTGNVFMAYRDVTEINALINGWKNTQKPMYDFVASDNIQHSVWVIDRDDVIHSITRLFETKVPATYIADGHHRAASAAKVSVQLSESKHANYFLTTIFPESQLAILDYNRVVTDLNGLTEEEFLNAIQKKFIVEKSNEPVKPQQQHEFGMYLNGKWFLLTAKKEIIAQDPIGVLDITILSNHILDNLLNIKDQRTDKRIDFVGGIRGMKELERRVDSGEMKIAFSFFPVTMKQLFDIADSGNIMPTKSTWFEPKLRDGLLTHCL